MKTECPHCHTLFRVNDEQLQHSGGQVRCGHCLAVFTAELPKQMSFDDLLDDQDDVTGMDADDIALNKVELPLRRATVSKTKKTDAGLHRDSGLLFDENTPDSISDTDTIDLEAFDTKASEINTDDMSSPVIELFADSNDTDEKRKPVLQDVIPPSLRAETRKGKTRFGFIGGVFWFLAICLMIAIGFAQYAWYDRMHLLQYPQARPWYELACHYLQCQLPEPRDTSQIELSRKNIYTHPNDIHALMVSGTMVNQAEFAQDFPLLELRFENIRGEAIAARRFAPEEYLDLPKDQIVKMQPGEPVAFTLEILDPGPEVVSYEFTFL